MCKGVEYVLEKQGDVLTLKDTVKAIPPETAGADLAGDIQVAPATTYFQGDSHHSFTINPHGTEGLYVLVPNRLPTPITLHKMSVVARNANLLGLFTSPKQALESGPVAGIILVLISAIVLVYPGYKIGRWRGHAAALARPKDVAMV